MPELPKADQSYRKKRCGFIRHLIHTYDHAVLGLICLNSFN